jgi:hypothetical protein
MCRRPLGQAEVKLVRKEFVSLYKIAADNGHVPEFEYDDRGFAKDLNSAGEVVERLAGITNEKCQRAKVISHVKQRMLRLAERAKGLAVVVAKDAEEAQKVVGLAAFNVKCEQLVIEAIGLPPTSGVFRALQGASLAHFSKAKRPQLVAFCHMRLFESSSLPRGTSFKFPKLKNAPGETGETLVEMAFRLRRTAVVLKNLPLPPPLPPPVIAPFVITAGTAARGAIELPSTLLKDDAWVASVWSNVSGRALDASMNRSPADFERADRTFQVLQRRLVVHLDLRAPGKEDHWAIEFMRANMARLTANAVLFGHVKKDVTCCSETSCLLSASTSRFVLIVNELGQLEGCYLHWDNEAGVWVRSGKVVGTESTKRNFEVRHKEHGAASQLLTLESKSSRFYNSYPASSSEAYSPVLRKGWFSDLSQFVGLGFSRANHAAVTALCAPVDGVLCWSKDAMNKTAKAKFAGCKTLQEKQLHMVGYLFELFYDLMLSSEINVSRSPGFEMCLGVFGGA